jgi:hypothetical protein
MKVKLAPGRALRDPVTRQPIPADQVRQVPDTSTYWRRRLRDGDVVLVEDQPAPTRRVPRHHEEGAA